VLIAAAAGRKDSPACLLTNGKVLRRGALDELPRLRLTLLRLVRSVRVVGSGRIM
jgi:hypothetical protein